MKKPMAVASHNLTEKLKQFLLYSLIEPPIYAWKTELTLIAMLSKTEESLYNLSSRDL